MDLSAIFPTRSGDHEECSLDPAVLTARYANHAKWAQLYHEAPDGILFDSFGIFVRRGYFVTCHLDFWEHKVKTRIKTRFILISVCDSLKRITLRSKCDAYLPNVMHGVIYVSE